MAKKLVALPSKFRKYTLRSIALLIAGYGVYAFFKRDISSYMILANQFVFFEFEEPFLWFLLDYMACMGTCISIGHYGSALLNLSYSNAILVFVIAQTSLNENML